MEENKKMGFNELYKLVVFKTSKAMEISREKGNKIEQKNNEILNETAILKLEKEKEELKEMQNDKEEFDQMTKNDLIEYAKNVNRIEREMEKNYEYKLLQMQEKYNDLEEKLQKMKERGLSDEKLQWAENSYASAKAKLDEENIDIQKTRKIKIRKLDRVKNAINEYSAELNIEDKIKSAMLEELSENKKNEQVNDNVKDTQKEAENKSEVKENNETVFTNGAVTNVTNTVGNTVRTETRAENIKTDENKEEIEEKSLTSFEERHPKLAKIPFIVKIVNKFQEMKERRKERNEMIEEYYKKYEDVYDKEPGLLEKLSIRISKKTRDKIDNEIEKVITDAEEYRDYLRENEKGYYLDEDYDENGNLKEGVKVGELKGNGTMDPNSRARRKQFVESYRQEPADVHHEESEESIEEENKSENKEIDEELEH